MKTAIKLIIISIVFAFSCQERDKHGKVVDTPTSGSIKIAADESLRPLVEAEVETFNGIYTRAHIETDFLPETDAVDAFLKDSVRLIVLSRHLTPDEKKYFKDIKIRISEIDVATSGIALIVNPANPDSVISMTQLREILKGNIKTWKEVGGKSNDGIEIVFDNPNSGLIRHLKDSVAKVDKLPPNCFAVKDNTAVVDHVAKNKNALGLIGVEWISDRDDSVSNNFLHRVSVVSVSGDSTDFQPYQAYMALKYYPLLRQITIISRESRVGLGSGFVAFFASERGQRIVLKAGLVPKTMPVRIVEINRKPFEIEQ